MASLWFDRITTTHHLKRSKDKRVDSERKIDIGTDNHTGCWKIHCPRPLEDRH